MSGCVKGENVCQTMEEDGTIKPYSKEFLALWSNLPEASRRRWTLISSLGDNLRWEHSADQATVHPIGDAVPIRILGQDLNILFHLTLSKLIEDAYLLDFSEVFLWLDF